MNIRQCLATAVEAGEISRVEAEDLNGRYESYRRANRADGWVDADARAKMELAAELRATASRNRRLTVLRAVAKQRVDAALDAYRLPNGRRDQGEAGIALVEHYGTAPYSSVVGRKKAIIGRVHSMMEQLIEEFERTKLLGKTPNKARLDNIAREAHGEATSDTSAKLMADVWRQAAEYLRARFNRAGGEIAKLENWGLPQQHNPLALLKATKEGWKAAIRPLLAPEKMRGPTGRPILAEDLDHILDDVFDSIVSGGWSKRDPSMQPQGRGTLAGRRADHRFLIFRDAESWLRYQRDFGEGDPFAAMMGHVNLMARDIAALEVLGPNPDGMIEYISQSITKGAAGTSRAAMARADRKVRTLQNMWRIERGQVDSPAGSRAGDVAAISRNWLTGSMLGSAILSALPTDPIYQTIARRMAGLRATRTLRDVARSMGKTERFRGVRAGLILDTAMHTMSQSARYLGTFSGPAWSRVIPDRVLAWSGLTAFTQAGRHAFGLEFMGMLADSAGTRWSDLGRRFRGVMERYGIDEAGWDTIRRAPIHDEDGARLLRPQDIDALDGRLADRVHEMILQETEYAVPSGTLRGRAMFIGTDQSGTLWGVLKSSAAMFKSFPVTYLMLHGTRLWAEWSQSKAAGAAYAAVLATTTTLGGMLSIWLKDVAAGRDPRPIEDPDGSVLPFLGAAFLQGGGLGILGDFLFADINRYGGGLATTLAGPLVATANDAWNLTVGNFVQLMAEGPEGTNFWDELTRFVSRNTPGNTLWYLRAGYQRVLIDGLERAIDPQANDAFRREQRYWQNNYGVDLWWQPGRSAPSRAPNLGAILPN